MIEIDPNTKALIFQVAFLAGGVYAGVQVLIAAVYPTLCNFVWQGFLGHFVESRWPGHSQSDDDQRPSYIPRGDDPIVFVCGYWLPPYREFSVGMRDGALLGVAALLAHNAVMIFLGCLIGSAIYRAIKSTWSFNGPQKVDRLFAMGRLILVYFGAIGAVRSTTIVL